MDDQLIDQMKQLTTSLTALGLAVAQMVDQNQHMLTLMLDSEAEQDEPVRDMKGRIIG